MRHVFGPAVAILALFISIPVVTHLWVELYLMPKWEQSASKLDRYQDKILQDLKLVEQEPFFKSEATERDATVILQSHIPLEDNQSPKPPALTSAEIQKLFGRYPNWKTNDQELRLLINDPAIQQINANWLTELTPYQTWNWRSALLNKDEIEDLSLKSGTDRIKYLAYMPIPNFSELEKLSVVYFAQSLKLGNPKSGMDVLRKTAQLLNSSKMLIGSLIAVSLLKSESRLVKFAPGLKWNPIPESTLEAYKRLSFVWFGIVERGLIKKNPSEIKSILNSKNGICIAAGERPLGLMVFEEYLGPRLPLERDFSNQITEAKTLQRDLLRLCDLELFEPLLNSTSANRDFWARIPYIRRAIGISKIINGTPNAARYYELDLQ